MKVTVGIDPGINCTGVAVFWGSYLSNVFLAQRVKKAPLNKNIIIQLDCLDSNLPEKVDVIVIEKPKIYPSSPVRSGDILDLAVMAGALARVRPYAEVVFVEPANWKGSVPKKIHNERIKKEIPELQKHLREYSQTKHEHIIDAAGQALWQIKKGKTT